METDAKNAAVEYREIPGLPRYLIGSDGTVLSNKIKRSTKIGPWRQLKLCPAYAGYLCVTLTRSDGYSKNFMVHQLMARIFIGPKPEGLEVCHNNGIKTDNRASNIRYGTHAENMADAVEHGAMRPGKRRPCDNTKKLTAELALRIRAQHAAGRPKSEIAKEIGCTKMTVSQVVNRRTWKHV